MTINEELKTPYVSPQLIEYLDGVFNTEGLLLSLIHISEPTRPY